MLNRRILPSSLRLLVFLAATPAVHASDYQRSYLINNVLWPTTPSQATSYGIDLDGDSLVDNNFGQWLSALASDGLDVNGPTGAAIAAGSFVHIIDLHSTDPGLADDPAAQADWYVGNSLPTPPLFDGTDTPGYSGTPGIFLAALSSGAFTSAAPATMAVPVDLTLLMQFGLNNPPVALPVQSARLSFTTDSIGPGHMQGQLNGAVRNDDFMVRVPPGMAVWFNQIIQADPTSTQSMNIKALFDKGCSGHPEYANDGWIEVCELTESPLMSTLWAPDVMTRDSSGTSAPSNSLGVRFTAVRRDRIFADGFGP